MAGAVGGHPHFFQGDHPDHNKKGAKMDLTLMPPREAIGAVYAGVPSVMWDFAGDDKTTKFEKVRKYCPTCKQADTLREIELTKENRQMRYRCRSCDALCRNPMALMPKGVSHSSSQVSRVDASTRVLRAMEASKIMDAVESLPDEYKIWLLWSYTDPEQGQRDRWEGRLLALLIDRVDKRISKGKTDEEAEKGGIRGIRAGADAVRVISMQMNCFRHERRIGKKLYRAADYARAIDKDRKQFDAARLWGRICAAAVSEMSEIDDEAMSPVEMVHVDLCRRSAYD